MEKLTPQEEEAMRRIWEIGPCAVRDLLETYPEPKPPYTTLASIIKNLERKQFVKARRLGNVYEYHALIEQGAYKRSFMHNIVAGFFGNSYKDVVSFFAREEKISAEDLKEIIEMIEQDSPENRKE